MDTITISKEYLYELISYKIDLEYYIEEAYKEGDPYRTYNLLKKAFELRYKKTCCIEDE